jgi:hypothetical protein
MIAFRPIVFAMLAWLGAVTCTTTAFSLTFSKHPDEAADENAILASGNIESDDAFRFQVYLGSLPQKPRTSLYLDSTGGSIQGAIAVGRIVYEAKIRTFLTGPAAKCFSACTNIFLAGRDRENGKSYRVKGSANGLGFHNFIPVLANKEYTAKDAADVVARAQNTIYEIATYFQEIDADLELLGLGLKQKDIYYLRNEDALRYGIHVLDAKTNELVRYESYRRYIKPD